MTSLYLRQLLLSLLLAPSALLAQGNSGNAGKKASDSPEGMWASLQATARLVAPVAARSGLKSADDVKAEHQQRAQAARQVALAAKSFLQAYPNDPRAAQARKLEVTASLQGVTDDDRAFEVLAIALGQRYRNDRGNAIADRFDVAVGVERMQLSRRLNRPVNSNSPAEEMEKIAGELRREFGELPQVYRLYASIARSAGMAAAERIAKVVLASTAPSETKAEARTMLSRQQLIGQRLPYVLHSLDGQIVDLAQPHDKPTAVLVWSAGLNPNGILGVKKFKDLSFTDCRWVYVSVDTTAAQLLAAKDKAPFPGVHCYYPPGSGAPLLEGLKNRHFPYVYLIDHKGLLAGFGPVGEFPNLLAAARR